MTKLHPEYQKRITMYVTTLMNAAPIYTDRDKTVEVWLNEFSYIKTTKEYMDFEDACKQIVNSNEPLNKMPLPGKIKQMISDNNIENEGLGPKPKVRLGVYNLHHKQLVLLGKMLSMGEGPAKDKLRLEHKNLVKQLCDMVNDK